jgi:hypothetical protein
MASAGGAMAAERDASSQGAKATLPVSWQPANTWAPPALGRCERGGVVTSQGG